MTRVGFGITFVDIDETLFRTTAKVRVVKDGLVLRELSNQEFNNYRLADGERFEFSAFKDAKLFKETSEPIVPVIERVKRMVGRIKETKSQSRIIVLTARPNMDDKELFLDVFRAVGIDVSRQDILYIERSGNSDVGTTADKKKAIILKYLRTGKYLRCRMIDDAKSNLDMFKELSLNLPEEVLSVTRENYGLSAKQPISFYGLLVHHDGSLERVL